MRRMFSRQSEAAAAGGLSVRKRSRTTMWAALGALGVIAYFWYQEWSRSRARQSLGKEVEKWEGEGGNVPEVPSVQPVPLSVPPTLH
jgi:uncharacterized membrane protein YebE (DUF533 family)